MANEDIDPKARERFGTEAKVSLIKASIFWASAKEEYVRGDYLATAVSAYYSIFHLSLFVMWLKPEYLQPAIKDKLIKIQDAGGPLPDKSISHGNIEEFLCEDHGELLVSVKELGELFKKAKGYREFASYGPRVTTNGDNIFIGPCSFTIETLNDIINETEKLIKQTVLSVLPKTAYDGMLGNIVVDQSIPMIEQSDLSFRKWSSPDIIKRASVLLEDIKRGVT